MSSNIKHHFESNSKVQSKNTVHALHQENALLMKRIETIENTNQNLVALTATITKQFDEIRERDIITMNMLGLIKDDYKEIISEKVTQNKEMKHIKYDEQQYKEFFEIDTFQTFFLDQIQKNSVVLEYK